MSSTNPQVDGRGALAAAISTSMVSLLHRYTGRGPTRARTTIDENVIVCVLGATLTKGEQSLVQGGDQEVVLESRRAFQRLMQDDAIASLQELCGRRVVAFISGNHIEPDLEKRKRENAYFVKVIEMAATLAERVTFSVGAIPERLDTGAQVTRAGAAPAPERTKDDPRGKGDGA